jgi:hypothetical protein
MILPLAGLTAATPLRRRGSLKALSTERRGQSVACSSERRHDPADRHFYRLSNLAVIKALDVAQHQRFAERRRQRSNRRAELFGVDLGEEGRFRCLHIRISWIGPRKFDRLKIIDGNDCSRPVFAQPGISGIAYNAQQPGAATAAGVFSDRREGAYSRN